MTVTAQLAKILVRSYNDARMARHEFLTPEHILRAALDSPVVCDLLNICGGDVESIREILNDYINNQIPVLPKNEKKSDTEETKPLETHSYQEIMNRAAYHCVSSEKDVVDITDVLVSMLDETKNYCCYSLKCGGIDRMHLLEAISYINGEQEKNDGIFFNSNSGTNSDEQIDDADFNLHGNSGKKSVLDRYTTNLTKLAAEGKLEGIIGRDEELDRTIQILCRKTKNNPLHVGDAGVGKTVLTEGLAIRIVNGEVPEELKDGEIFSLNGNSLVAGAKFRGDFEERLGKIADELAKRKNAILFIDEINSIVSSNPMGNSYADVANILKPIFAKRKIRCIGTTTFEGYKKTFEKDHGLLRRFQKIDVLEPDRDKAVKILMGLRKKYEEFHSVIFSEKAIEAAVDLSIQYMPDRRLPDKAFDIIDEAGSLIRIRRNGGFYGRTNHKSTKIPCVSVKDIKIVAAKMARVPVENVQGSEIEKLRNLENNLGTQIFGQSEAVQLITRAVKKARAGFRNPDKPEGCFLFVGPTGVGKTELARCLANSLGLKLLRYDMSEYQEKHTVSRLIGAPPGYVGFEDGGLLTDAVRKEPHSVILLDEIEKAHEDIYNVLLQVMDYGFLTDNQGRKADFRSCIIIMTSNAGARDMEKGVIGFGSEETSNSNATLKEAVDKAFSPEFRNRLDAIVPFDHLQKSVICSIVKKEVAKLSERLASRKVKLSVTDECAEYLADSGYSREFGARNIARIVDEKISTPLADEVLFGKLAGGGKVTVSLVCNKEKSEVAFTYGK